MAGKLDEVGGVVMFKKVYKWSLLIVIIMDLIFSIISMDRYYLFVGLINLLMLYLVVIDEKMGHVEGKINSLIEAMGEENNLLKLIIKNDEIKLDMFRKLLKGQNGKPTE